MWRKKRKLPEDLWPNRKRSFSASKMSSARNEKLKEQMKLYIVTGMEKLMSRRRRRKKKKKKV